MKKHWFHRDLEILKPLFEKMRMETMAIPLAAIGRAIAFAIEQPAEVDVNEIVVRPTAQG